MRLTVPLHWRPSMLLLFICLFCAVWQTWQQNSNDVIGYSGPEHALSRELFDLFKQCDANLTQCVENTEKISSLSAKIANEHSALLLHDRALDIFDDILYFMQSEHILGKRAAHILSVLSFAQGRTVQVG